MACSPNWARTRSNIPEEWLRAITEKFLTEEERAAIEELGDWDEIMETLKKRLEEQEGRHEGGNKWIGTGGTSPFGHSGYNPAGVRIGGESRHRRAIKVWEKREFANLDNSRELGTRNIKVALRRLRRFAREGRCRRAGSRRHDPRHGQAGLAGHPHAARASQCGEAAAVPGCRRIDGRPCQS